MTNELKPCPFTGKKAKLCKTKSQAGKIKYYACCGDVQTKYFTQGRSAIRVWNTRAQPPAVSELVNAYMDGFKASYEGGNGDTFTERELEELRKEVIANYKKEGE